MKQLRDKVGESTRVKQSSDYINETLNIKAHTIKRFNKHNQLLMKVVSLL